MVTFEAVATHSTLIDENDFFRHYYNSEALFRYDSNFFQLKYSPTKVEFELIETMHWNFSEEYDLTHVKFYWPENQGIHPDTLDYLNQEDYGLEKVELYSIAPFDFTAVAENLDISIHVVNHEQLDTFKSINYIEDKIISTSFAEAKQPFYDKLFQDKSITFLLAYYKGKAAGSCIIVESTEGLELDDLFTLKEYRLKGVAKALLDYIIKQATPKQKTVFLVADAEDSPKEMYIKSGFNYEGFRIGAQKAIKGDD
ncbi:GNAT family N-acetyltransferase [Alkalibacterium sp. f15]|uniref:GNAT family N-acetyltransferase n=1 Tax=Alkalibacterium sp. f15 TaxID=3414029 RepID=UPI003BF9047A